MKPLSIKITLDKKALPELRELRDAISQIVEAARRGDAKLNALLDRESKLSAEVSRLEGKAGRDASAARRLPGLRETLRAVKAEVNALQSSPGQEEFATQVRQLMHDFSRNIWPRAFKPAVAGLLQRVAPALLPFCRNQDESLRYAATLPAVMAFGNFLNCCYWADGIANAARAVAMVDEALAGKLTWTYRPGI